MKRTNTSGIIKDATIVNIRPIRRYIAKRLEPCAMFSHIYFKFFAILCFWLILDVSLDILCKVTVYYAIVSDVFGYERISSNHTSLSKSYTFAYCYSLDTLYHNPSSNSNMPANHNFAMVLRYQRSSSCFKPSVKTAEPDGPIV